MPGWQFAKRKFIKLRNLKLCVLHFVSTDHKSEAEVSEAQVFESTLSKAKMHANIQLETILASDISA